MSAVRDDIQDATGKRTFYAGLGYLRGFGFGSRYASGLNGSIGGIAGNPINGEANWAPGAQFQNTLATTLGNFFWVNTGTALSATWTNIDAEVAGSLGDSNTAVTASVGTTFTAAAFNGHLITRSGPTANFSDATPKAADIIAALPAGAAVGKSYIMRIINTTPWVETLTNGVGVTQTGITIIPPNSTLIALVTYTGAGAVTMYGIHLAPDVIQPLIVETSLATVGNGTITAAGIAGGITVRSGSTSAFTDTTDSVTNLLAALPNAVVGQSFYWVYQNETNSTATIQGASNVTVSGITNIPAASWAQFLVTVASATTFTIQGVEFGPLTPVPVTQYATGTTTTTFTAGELTGGALTVYNNTQATPGTITTRTAGQMFGDIPNCVIGFSYVLRIINGQGTGTLTVGLGSGLTNPNSSSLTIAINTWREFIVTFTSATAATITQIGTGTNS